MTLCNQILKKTRLSYSTIAKFTSSNFFFELANDLKFYYNK